MGRTQRRATIAALGVGIAAGLWGAGARAGCGDAPEPCRIVGGSYHIVLPDAPGPDGAAPPALMFLHGWGASGAATLRMRGVVRAALDRGYAVIAPDGIARQGRTGLSWGFHPDRPGPRDEVAFLLAVRDDAIARHGIDPGRVLLGGFSIGGSMTSYLACAAPDAFAAYVPVAGSFWYPPPADCAGPVNLFQTHGWSDRVMPLEGRILGGGTARQAPGVFAQGDVWQSLQLWRRTDDCRPNPDTYARTGSFWRRGWRGCGSGRSLVFALFDGGHAVPGGWTDMVLDWFEGL